MAPFGWLKRRRLDDDDFQDEIRAHLAIAADERMASDVRYAIRALAKNPAYSLTLVGVLTLGIGLNAAVFTMLKGMALTPLAGVGGSSQAAW